MSKIDLLSGISSGPRLEILNMLYKEPLRATLISKNCQSSIQAISRHLEKLVESKLIEKTTDGQYRITPIGIASLLQLPFFEFLGKNKEYFTDHDFEGIPDHLIARLGDLAECKYEPDPMKSARLARDHCSQATEFLYGATFTTFPDLYDIVLPKLKKGLKFRIVLGTNSVLSRGFSEHPARIECKKFPPEICGEKIIREVRPSVGYSEKHCHVMFAEKKLGHMGGTGVFFGDDKKSIKWCKELFEYYWNQPEIKNFSLQEQ